MVLDLKEIMKKEQLSLLLFCFFMYHSFSQLIHPNHINRGSLYGIST